MGATAVAIVTFVAVFGSIVGKAQVFQPTPAPLITAAGAEWRLRGEPVFSAGDFSEQPNRESVVLSDKRRGIYKRVVLEGNKVCGAVLFGDVSEAAKLRDLIEGRVDIGAMRDELLFDSPAAA